MLTKWDIRHLELAELVAKWSKDPSTKVGAYICDHLRRPVSNGYNGFPMGMIDSVELLNTRELKYPRIVHAELNALSFANRVDLSDCILYVTHPPCIPCLSAARQRGVKRIISLSGDDKFKSRWNLNDSVQYAADIGIHMSIYNKTTDGYEQIV